MITFYGYAVKKDGKYLGFDPKRDRFGRLLKKFYARPKFPIVERKKNATVVDYGFFGEVVHVKLTMEEVR